MHINSVDYINFSTPPLEHQNNLDLFHDIHRKGGKLTLPQKAAPLFPKINPPHVTPVPLPDGPAEIGTFFRFDNQVDVVRHQAVCQN